MMMKRLLLGAALLASATGAQAQSWTFTGGGSSPATGQTVLYDFDTSIPTITGANYLILSPPANSNGAPPAFASPAGDYLSVLTRGSATINFAPGVGQFSFDWGSVDDYNTLSVTGSFGTVSYTGSTVAAPAQGNQGNAANNGLFTFSGDGGTISSFTLTSSANSFEIDNVAVGGVPEPTTWAMMILGVGAVGGTLRRRRAVARPAIA